MRKSKIIIISGMCIILLSMGLAVWVIRINKKLNIKNEKQNTTIRFETPEMEGQLRQVIGEPKKELDKWDILIYRHILEALQGGSDIKNEDNYVTLSDKIEFNDSILMVKLHLYKKLDKPTVEVPTIEEIKTSLNTYEKTKADEKIHYFAAWYGMGGRNHYLDYKRYFTVAMSRLPEYSDRWMDSLTMEEIEYLYDYIETHPETKDWDEYERIRFGK